MCGFNQVALDQVARHGYSNAQFEVGGEEGLDLAEEFYTDEAVGVEQVQPESKTKVKPKLNQAKNFVQDIQQGLWQSVQNLN